MEGAAAPAWLDRLALRQHIIDVAQECKTVAEFQAALQADGSLDKLG